MSVCDKGQASNNEREKKNILANGIIGRRLIFLIIKITANVIVISLLQTFRPSSGAIFNEQ